MRILVFEFVSGGGFAEQDLPRPLAREGAAMLTALVADLALMGLHQIVTTTDPRCRLRAPDDVEIVTLAGKTWRSGLDDLIAAADAVWLVAPETQGCLERLAATVERKGKVLLGPGAAAIRCASDKARLPLRLAAHRVPHPTTRRIVAGRDARHVAHRLGYPLIVKPARGAGCDGVSLVRNPRELRQAIQVAQSACGDGPLLCQRYITGVAASVSLLANGTRAVPLAANAQSVRRSSPFSYLGGRTPLDHPLAERAIEVAVLASEALPGLRGYVGVDVVLTKSEAFVIEVNPRLTTAYLGVRSVVNENVAALALAACSGTLPVRPNTSRRVRFTAGGKVH